MLIKAVLAAVFVTAAFFSFARAHSPDAEATVCFSPDCFGDPVILSETIPPAVIHCDDGEDRRVQIVLLYSGDDPGPLVEIIRQIASVVDEIFVNSAAKTGGYRAVRWVRNNDCEIDVLILATIDVLAPAGLVEQVQGLGLLDNTRKYILFTDLPGPCWGYVYADSRKTQYNFNNTSRGYARISSSCWIGGLVAHELTHMLGGVQIDAPNTTGGWHCTDVHDIMCYSDLPYRPPTRLLCPDATSRFLLDCNEDDYFNLDPPEGSYLAEHWSVSDSSFLMAEEQSAPVESRPQWWFPMIIDSVLNQGSGLSRKQCYTGYVALAAHNPESNPPCNRRERRKMRNYAVESLLSGDEGVIAVVPVRASSPKKARRIIEKKYRGYVVQTVRLIDRNGRQSRQRRL